MSRQYHSGAPLPNPRSVITQERVFITGGISDLPDMQTPQSSVVSAQNCWNWQGRVTPRPRLVNLGNVLADKPTGAFQYFDVNGVQYPMLFSKSTAAYFSNATWASLAYVSGTSNNPPTGGQNDKIFGTSVYLPRADANLAVWVNGIDPAFCWAGPSSGTAYSTLTQSYVANDVTLDHSRLFYWNVRYLSSTSQLVTRAAWTAAGNPEDTTGVDSGWQDLLDMRGYGTRCFTLGDQLVVATDQEIARGVFVGQAFTYDFTPITRTVGIPFARAALNTPEGLFWLGNDFMVYNLSPYGQITPIGGDIQRTLHRNVADPNTAFFGYHGDAKMLTIYFSDTAGNYPQRALTYSMLGKNWMPQKYSQQLVVGFQAQQSSSQTTWGALVGPLSGNNLTYNQLLGQGASSINEAVAASAGTAYVNDFYRTQTTDDGTAVPCETALGPFFSTIPQRRKFCDDVRLDIQADASSQISVALSGDMGNTYPSEISFTVSANSNSSQYHVRLPGVSAANQMVRVRSTGGNWSLNAVTVKGTIQGDVV